MVDDDLIEVGPPLSALMDTYGNHTSLTFKLDVVLTPPRGLEDKTSYQVLGRLGKGTSGRVLSVRNTLNKTHFAIKTVKADGSNLDRRLLEPFIWRDLKHEFICQYHRHWVDATRGGDKAVICAYETRMLQSRCSHFGPPTPQIS